MRHQYLQFRQLYKSLIRAVLLLLSLGLLGACARIPVLPIGDAQLPEHVELASVPFYPQQAYQCGPAALATMLVHRKIGVTPEQLVEQVYIPERKGSLQVEMVAAARAHELVVYPLAPNLEAVLAEVAAGNPVLVLQNLGFDRLPQWHFAVVIGYDLSSQSVILRSGTTRRWEGSFRSFIRSWAKGDRWAVVMVEPTDIPATAEEGSWLTAASDLEQTGHIESARRAYEAATRRWAGHLSWFALGNVEYVLGDKQFAERALRRSVAQESGFAAAWFNLSQILAEQGCATQAYEARQCAARLKPNDSRFRGHPSVVGSSEGPACYKLPQCLPTTER